jgi:hypothetical protein
MEADCLDLVARHPAAPDRVQEHIRASAVLLCAEFQGYCRELHTECARKMVAGVTPAALQRVLLAQSLYGRKLATGNPTPGNLGADFGRFLIDFWPAVEAADVAHVARKHRLAALNAWRNAVGHNDYDTVALGGSKTLTIVQVRDWRADCDAFAITFDAVMRDHLQTITGVAPW